MKEAALMGKSFAIMAVRDACGNHGRGKESACGWL